MGQRRRASTTPTCLELRRARQAFKGFEAIAVSRIDDPQTPADAAIVDDKNDWMAPVIAQQAERGAVRGQGADLGRQRRVEPVLRQRLRLLRRFRVGGTGSRRSRSSSRPRRDGGDTWTQKQVTPGDDNVAQPNGFGQSGCTIRTDSHGVVYVFDVPVRGPAIAGRRHDPADQVASTAARRWTTALRDISAIDTVQRRRRRRSDGASRTASPARATTSSPAPSVDIANGAPIGCDATEPDRRPGSTAATA